MREFSERLRSAKRKGGCEKNDGFSLRDPGEAGSFGDRRGVHRDTAKFINRTSRFPESIVGRSGRDRDL